MTSAPRLLVVDNQLDRGRLLAEELDQQGFVVGSASTSADALERVVSWRPDCVVIETSVRDDHVIGLDLLDQIRARFAITALPVVMTSPAEDGKAVIEALSRGANDFLSRPFEISMVAAKLNLHLSLREASRGQRTRGTGPTRLARSGRYCARCQTYQGDTDAILCSECGARRPVDGWPPTSGSGHRYLGATIGDRFHLDRFLAAGASGSVYRCRDLRLRRLFAVKVLTLSDNPHDPIRRQLEAEVKAMAQLSNPHVVKISEFLDLGFGDVGLVMDFVSGLTMGEVLDRGGAMTPVLALDVVRQVAQGLFEAHQQGMIHRDVKPDNIMLEKLPAGGYHARLVDFGIVKEAGSSRTGVGFVGTPAYMSPEHIQDDLPFDHRADIYSLGATLFHGLTGQSPYDSSSVYTMLRRHIHDPLPTVAGKLAGCAEAPAIEALVHRMLAKSAEDRFDDLTGVVSACSTIIGTLGESSIRAAQLNGDQSQTQTLDVGADTLGVRPLYRRVRWRPEHRFPSLSPNGRVAVVCRQSDRDVVEHYDFPAGRVRRIPLPEHSRATMLAIDRGGMLAVVALDNASAQVVDFENGRARPVAEFPTSPVSAMAVAADGGLIAAGTIDGQVFILEQEQQPLLIGQPGEPVTALAISPRWSEVMIARRGGEFVVSPLTGGGLRQSLPSLGEDIVASCFDRIGDTGAALLSSGRLVVFLPAVGSAVKQLDYGFSATLALTYSADNRLVCLAGKGDHAQLWDIGELVEERMGRTTVLRVGA